jgi:hypothetical protein
VGTQSIERAPETPFRRNQDRESAYHLLTYQSGAAPMISEPERLRRGRVRAAFRLMTKLSQLLPHIYPPHDIFARMVEIEPTTTTEDLNRLDREHKEQVEALTRIDKFLSKLPRDERQKGRIREIVERHALSGNKAARKLLKSGDLEVIS